MLSTLDRCLRRVDGEGVEQLSCGPDLFALHQQRPVEVDVEWLKLSGASTGHLDQLQVHRCGGLADGRGPVRLEAVDDESSGRQRV